MRIGKLTLTAAAIAVAGAPIAGQAIAADRSASPVAGENAIGGGTSIAVAFVLLAFAAFIFIDDDEPASP